MTGVQLLMSSLLLMVPAPGGSREEPSLVGKIIVVKNTDVPLVRLGDNGKEELLETLTEQDYVVLAQSADRFQVKSRRGSIGWVSKSKVVPLDEAPTYFSKRLLQNFTNATAYNARGNVWRLQGEFDLAAKDIEAALLLTKTAAVYNNRGLLYYARKDYDKAIADFDQAIILDRKFIPARYNCGLAWEAKYDFLSAEEEYSAVIRLDKQDVKALVRRGYCRYRQREQTRAIADFSEAIRLDPKNAEAYNLRGRAFWSKEGPAKALADYKTALGIDPKCLAAHYNIGCVYEEEKDYAKAIAEYAEEIRLNPQFMLGHWGRASAQHHMKEYAKALADYNDALKLDPKNRSLCSAVAWLLATSADAKVRDGKRAVELAHFAVKEDKTSVMAMNSLAAAYAEIGDFAQAVHWQQEAIDEAARQTNLPGSLDPVGRNSSGMEQRLEQYRKNEPYRQGQG